ncbi:958_t:CDS:10 [Ambispora gerdemannii]|uniref:chitin synthase n=1 Tax=Ambispora gerdemannii TaxID=144530 RepID=A0A9N8Z7R8_9GLOM|nr:958_t:CDS:10 [Ambispora gerdemannii]
MTESQTGHTSSSKPTHLIYYHSNTEFEPPLKSAESSILSATTIRELRCHVRFLISSVPEGPQRPIDGALKVAEIIALGIETLEKHGIRYVPGSLPEQIGILDTFQNKMAISVQKDDGENTFYEKIYGNVIDDSSIPKKNKNKNKKSYYSMDVDETCARTRCDKTSLVSERCISEMNGHNPFIEIIHSEEFLATKKEWKFKEKNVQDTRAKHRGEAEKEKQQKFNNHIGDFGNLRSIAPTIDSSIDLTRYKQLKKPGETVKDRLMSRPTGCEAITGSFEKDEIMLLSLSAEKDPSEKLHEEIPLSPSLQTVIKQEIIETPLSLKNNNTYHQIVQKEVPNMNVYCDGGCKDPSKCFRWYSFSDVDNDDDYDYAYASRTVDIHTTKNNNSLVTRDFMAFSKPVISNGSILPHFRSSIMAKEAGLPNWGSKADLEDRINDNKRSSKLFEYLPYATTRITRRQREKQERKKQEAAAEFLCVMSAAKCCSASYKEYDDNICIVSSLLRLREDQRYTQGRHDEEVILESVWNRQITDPIIEFFLQIINVFCVQKQSQTNTTEEKNQHEVGNTQTADMKMNYDEKINSRHISIKETPKTWTVLNKKVSVEYLRSNDNNNNTMVPMTGISTDAYVSKGFMAPVNDPKGKRVAIVPKRNANKRLSEYYKSAAYSMNRFSTAPHVRQDMAPRQKFTPWVIFSKLTTLFFSDKFLSKIGKLENPQTRQAWREKVALCLCIVFVSLGLGFMTFGFLQVTCTGKLNIYRQVVENRFGAGKDQRAMIVRGKVYNVGNYFQSGFHRPILPFTDDTLNDVIVPRYGKDISDLFPLNNNDIECAYTPVYNNGALCAGAQTNNTKLHCHTSRGSIDALESVWNGNFVAYAWENITDVSKRQYFVWKQKVYDVTEVLANPNHWFNNNSTRTLLSPLIGTDATKFLAQQKNLSSTTNCFEHFLVGKVDGREVGCSIANLVVIFMTAIFTIVATIKFLSATVYDWFISEKISRILATPKSKEETKYTIILVPCYSEDEASMRATFDSLAASDYSNEHKLFFVISDGNITGSGNEKSTPQILKGLIEVKSPRIGDPEPKSYIALGNGKKRHNMAQVYAGYYNYEDQQVPMILVNKCGTPEEQDEPKAGNRGKRDTQLILMQLLTHAFFNEKMTELEFDIFEKVRLITNGVTIDRYELVAMVDSDTLLKRDALKRMVATMDNDPKVIGVCGETKLLNRYQSWVTMIQVFDYYISHHLGKTFESIFGRVICLPGCFCMYRVYATKYNGLRVPILANPDILKAYSSNTVDTLHQKNLLLLGEDRYLTTLMLKTFPQRKTLYCSTAICHTVVPHTFSVLLSQRRRWINGTVHNLMELLLVSQLPGKFCFSMQFVVFLELFSTVTTPFAVIFLAYLLVGLALGQSVVLPLLYFAAILMLQAVFVMITSHKPLYVVWFLVFFAAFPIWNLILPAYAFWHFDDFSWGATRKIDGTDTDHSDNSSFDYFDPRIIKWKKWDEWISDLPTYSSLSTKTESDKESSVAEAFEKLTGEKIDNVNNDKNV